MECHCGKAANHPGKCRTKEEHEAIIALRKRAFEARTLREKAAEDKIQQISNFIYALARIKGLRTAETVILALCSGEEETHNKLANEIVADIRNDCLEYDTVDSIPETYLPTPNPFNPVTS